MSGSGGQPQARPTAAMTAVATAPAQPPGTNLRTGCATCSGTQPCDCAKLVVSSKKDDTPPRELSTTTKLRGTRVAPLLLAAHPRASDFNEFDLIIESVAAYRDQGVPPPGEELVQLKAETEWAPVCANGCAHVLELLAEHHEEPGLPLHHPTKVETARPIRAESMNGWESDFSTNSNMLQMLLGVLALYEGGRAGPKRFIARANSCGVRPGGQTPNGDLRALFLVYRKTKIEYTLTIPPWRDGEGSRGTHRVGGVDVASDTRTRTARGVLSGEEVRQRGLGAQGPNGQRAGGPSPYNPFSMSQPLRTTGGDERIVGTASVEQDLQLSIKINGRELELMQLRRRAIEKLLGMQRIVDGFADLIKKAPQIGWGLSYRFGFPSGSLSIIQERTESNVPLGGRLLPAPMTLSIRGELVFFKLWAELSFGFHVEGRWGTLTARAGVTLGGEAKTSVALRLPGGTAKWEAEASIPAEVFIHAEVRVANVWTISGRATAASGLKLDCKIYDGTPQAPSATPPSPWKLEMKLKALRGLATGTVTSFGMTYPYNYEMWPETDIRLRDSNTTESGGARP